MKKFLSVVLAAALLLACVPMLPIGVDAATSGDYTYTVSNGEATITDYTGAGGDITIPSTLGGYPVTGIGEYAFYRCDSLTSVTIPDGVTTIGDEAFMICDSLTSVTIPDGVTTIGDEAFMSCVSLTSVTIPDSVTSIGEGAFMSCVSLTRVTIPASVTSIGDDAFSDCYGLTSVTIPASVTTIGDCAFFECPSLTVYYGGTQSQWNAISIGSDNYALDEATILYNHIHNYDLLEPVTVKPTCTSVGYIEYTCALGESYRETLPALGHTAGSNGVATPPTCTEQGYTTYTCIRCPAEIIADYVAALGHDGAGAATVVEPTCTEQGYTNVECTRCGAEEKTSFVDSLGHKMAVVPAVPATCTQTGLTAGTVCERCDMVGVAQREVAPNGIHDYVDGICADCDDVCDIGDANGDKTINTQDTLVIMKYLADWDVEINLENADVNGDGKINTQDSLLLMKYLAGYGVTL